jgi:sec-independent protein translocase protein TatA
MYSLILLFLNIGGSEMILIVFVALLLFGGEKLPEIARGLGKGIRDFKDASDGVKREIANQINNFEEKKQEEALNKAAEEQSAKLLPEAQEPTGETSETSASLDHINNGGVANTMPYVENHVPSTETPETEKNTEIAEPGNEVKSEPVKTTHE